AAAVMFGSYVAISLAGGLTFNTALIALPKLVDERVGEGVPLIVVGWLATGIFLCGALAQLAVGRLIERAQPHILFATVATVQVVGLVWAGHATGAALIAALGVAIGAIYGQTTVGDIVIARYTADAWRGRVYAVRYFLTFITSGIAVQLIARLYGRGGFDLVLAAIALTAFVMMAGVFRLATAGQGGRGGPPGGAAGGVGAACIQRVDNAVSPPPIHLIGHIAAAEVASPSSTFARQRLNRYPTADFAASFRNANPVPTAKGGQPNRYSRRPPWWLPELNRAGGHRCRRRQTGTTFSELPRRRSAAAAHQAARVGSGAF